MQRIGSYVGKFLPPHVGHLNSINFALQRCDKLYIVVAEDPAKSARLCKENGFDPIPAEMRIKWLKDHYCGNKKVEVVYFDETGLASFPYGMYEWESRFREKMDPRINIRFGDESFRVFYERHFPECEFIAYDKDEIPVSGSMIRKDLHQNIVCIIPEAQDYFIKLLPNLPPRKLRFDDEIDA